MARAARMIADETSDLDVLFIRYLLTHPDVAEQIPHKAIVVFEDPCDAAATARERAVAEHNQRRSVAAGEGEKPIVHVVVERTPEQEIVFAPRTVTPADTA